MRQNDTSDQENNASEISEGSEKKRRFTGIWIPREIYLRKDINMLEKILWIEIDSLHDEEKGGCFASEEYLCNFIGVKRRQLYEMLKHLKELGMVVDVSFNGRQKVRKAIKTKELTETHAQQQCGKPHTSRAENRTPSPYSIYNKDIDNISPKGDTRTRENAPVGAHAASAAPPPPIQKKSKEEVSKKTKFVELDDPTEEEIFLGTHRVGYTEEEWKKLVDRFGEIRVREASKKMGEWAIKNKKNIVSTYRSLINWIEKDKQWEAEKPKPKEEKPHPRANFEAAKSYVLPSNLSRWKDE